MHVGQYQIGIVPHNEMSKLGIYIYDLFLLFVL